jgi:hypothetical protein
MGRTMQVAAREPGTYTVLVTGANGCSAVDTVDVVEDAAQPSVDATTEGSLNCRVRQVIVKAAVRGGTAPYTYEWRNGAGTLVGTESEIAIDAGGEYEVTVTGANGCSARDTVVVAEDASSPTVDAGPDRDLDCRVRRVVVKAAVRGGTPPYAYEWRSGAGTLVGTESEITIDVADTYIVTVVGANGCSADDTVAVAEDVSPPTVDAGADRSLDCRARQVVVRAAVSGGTPPYTYEWRNAAGAVVGTENEIIVDVAGTYAVTVCGANGCSANDTVAVVDDTSAPTVDAGPDRSLDCRTRKVTLKASVSGGKPPFSYEWRTTAGAVVGAQDEITVSSGGAYTATVTGANGCSATDTVNVVLDASPPTVDAGADRSLDCRTRQVTVQATVTGGTAPFSYEWRNSSGAIVGRERTLTIETADVYAVTVTGANGCSGGDTVQVTEDVEAPVAQATVERPLTCANPETTLSAGVTGGRPPYGVEWRSPDGHAIGETMKIQVALPGTYTVFVTGANGCSASAAVTVIRDMEPPLVGVTADGALTCANPEVALTATVTGGRPPYTVEWQNACGMPVGYAESIVVHEVGTYSVVVTGANGCSVSSSVAVTEDLEAPTVRATGNRHLTCAVSQTTLTADVAGGRPPYVVEWRTDRGMLLAYARSITVSEPGTYVVKAVGANGCRATDSVTVTEDVTPPLVDAGRDRALTCDDAMALLDITVREGMPPYAYLWIDDCGKEIAITEDITVTRPGLYTVVVTGANGCSSSASVRVVSKIAPPTVDAGPDRLLTCDASEVLLDATVSGGSAPYEYVWTDACGVVVGTTQDLEVAQPGVYALLVRTADGCVGMDSVIVTQASN